MPAQHPTLYLFAGSNGAGKTTFARAYLRQLAPIPRFLNADEIARGLSPLEPQKLAVKAGKLLLHEVQDCLESGVSFGVAGTALRSRPVRGTRMELKMIQRKIAAHFPAILIPRSRTARRIGPCRAREIPRLPNHETPLAPIHIAPWRQTSRER